MILVFNKYIQHLVYFLRKEQVETYRGVVNCVNNNDRKSVESYQRKLLVDLLNNSKGVYYPQQKKIIEELRPFEERDVLELLRCIPVAEKKEISNFSRGIKNNFGVQLDWRTTSGSTGTPCGFFKDRIATGFMQAVQDVARGWYGVEWFSRQGYFWGADRFGRKKILNRLKDLVKNRFRMSAFELSEREKISNVCKLRRFSPDFLYGYPSVIAEYGRFILERREDLRDLSLKAVFVTGEMLLEKDRAVMEKAFLAPVVSEYGCTELGVIAFECRSGYLHIMESNVYVEVLDDDGEDAGEEEGSVIVTELNSRFLPFIRYRLGDRGRILKGECSCGRSLRRLSLEAGRKNDYVVTPEDKKVYSSIFSYVFKEGFSEFKVRQTSVDKIIVDYVPNSNFKECIISRYEKELKLKISYNIDFKFNKLFSIPRDPSGKLSYFTNELLKD